MAKKAIPTYRLYKNNVAIPKSIFCELSHEMGVSPLSFMHLTREDKNDRFRRNTPIFQELLTADPQRIRASLQRVVNSNFPRASEKQPRARRESIAFDAVAAYADYHGISLKKAFGLFGGDLGKPAKKAFLVASDATRPFVSELIDLVLPEAARNLKTFTDGTGKNINILYRVLKSAEAFGIESAWIQVFDSDVELEHISGYRSYTIGPAALVPVELNR